MCSPLFCWFKSPAEPTGRTSAAFEYGRVWPLSFYCRSGHTSRFCLSSETDNQQTDDGSQDIYPEKKLIVTY